MAAELRPFCLGCAAEGFQPVGAVDKLQVGEFEAELCKDCQAWFKMVGPSKLPQKGTEFQISFLLG